MSSARLESPYIGRQDSLKQVRGLLETGVRLITLLGTAGIGKTRLARQLGLDALQTPHYPGGVHFCDLTAAHTARDILDAVASLLQVPVLESDALDPAIVQVGKALAARGPLLLILDNFEQLVRSALEVPRRWLELAPQAQLLITSRIRLSLEAERCYELVPLTDDEAVQLFELRAQAVRRGRPALEADPATLKALVRRLDGLPLALELAASWTHILSPTQLLERLDARLEEHLDLLRSRTVDGSRRNSTLRGALDASWELLSPLEQATFRQCAIFAGPFTAEAAEAILVPQAADPAPGPAVGVLELLAALMDQSLLVECAGPQSSSPLHLRFYESIRIYALERLQGAPDFPDLVRRHAEWFLRRAEQCLPRLEGPDAAIALLELQALQHELACILKRGDQGEVLTPHYKARAVLALAELFNRRRRHQLEPLFEGLDLEEVEDPRLRAHLILNRAWSRFEADQHSRRTEEAEQAYRLALEHGLEGVASRALLALAHTAMNQGNTARALELTQEGCRRCASVGDRFGEAQHLSAQGMLYRRQGTYALARQCLTRALSVWSGDTGQPQASILNNLALVYLDQGDSGQARRLLTQALEVPGNGDVYEHAAILANLAAVTHLEQHFATARQTYQAAISAFEQLGRGLATYVSWIGLGILELQCGDLTLAEQHLNTASTLCRSLLQPPDQVRVLAFLGGVYAARGDLQAARASLDAAARLLSTLEGARQSVLSSLLHLLEGVLEVHTARWEPDAVQASKLLQAAEMRLSEQGAGGTTASAQTSFYEQMAIQLLQAGLLVAARHRSAAAVKGDPSALTSPERPRAALVSPPLPDRVLVVDPQGQWFERAGQARVVLTRRRTLCLLLRALAEARVAACGTALAVHDLFAAGWPDQRVQHQAATFRVYSALASLRRLGLEEVLINQYGGYLLDPGMAVEWGH